MNQGRRYRRPLTCSPYLAGLKLAPHGHHVDPTAVLGNFAVDDAILAVQRNINGVARWGGSEERPGMRAFHGHSDKDLLPLGDHLFHGVALIGKSLQIFEFHPLVAN